MTEPTHQSPNGSSPSWGIYASVFLISFCVLSLEITLSRLFSVVLRYHFVFLIISITICGLGLGGLALHVWNTSASRRRLNILALSAFGFAVSTVVTLMLLMRVMVPFHIDRYGVIALLLLAPFFCAGVFLAEVFRLYPARSGRLYGADLIGAAAASVAVVGMLQWWGAINACLWIAALSLLCLLALPISRRTLVAGFAIAMLLMLAAFAGGNRTPAWLDVPPIHVRNPALAADMTKPLFTSLTKPPATRPRIVFTAWTAFARTDVVEDPEVGDDTKFVFTNGHVPTHMLRFRGDIEELRKLRYELGYLPFGVDKPQRVLCIGPGAGMDVHFGLLSGAPQIDGVEINPSILPIMHKFREFNGGLYERPNVHVVTDEGRSFVQRSRDSYDLIFLALTQTSTSGHSGLTLMESYVHTLDAFHDYWERLSSHGTLALIAQDYNVVTRMFTTGITSLKRRGFSDRDACQHIALIRVPDERMHYGPYRYLFLMKKSAWTAVEAEAMTRFAREAFLQPMFVPHGEQGQPFASVAGGAWTLAQLIDSFRHEHAKHGFPAPVNVAPCTDDSPFFLDLTFGVLPLFYGLCGAAAGLVALFAAWVLAWNRTQRPGPVKHTLSLLAYFACLGVGFMLVEIPLLQKLILVLGYPTLAMAVILFALLLGGGLGSMASQRWTENKLTQRLPVFVGIVAAVSVAYAIYFSRPHPDLLQLPLAARCAVVIALLLPLGFSLGVPFPTGVRLMSRMYAADIPWMWGVNGVMSVVGSLLAAIGAKLFGFKLVMLTGAGVYLLVLFLLPVMKRSTAALPVQSMPSP